MVDAHNPTYPALWYGGTGFANATIYVLTANRTVDLSLSGTNTAPVAVADTYTTAQTTTLTVATPGVLANDTDAESNPLTAVLNTNVGHGTLTLNANGSFSYIPTAAYTGPDSFTYHANDGSLSSNVVTVSLTVSLSGPVTLSGNLTGNGGLALAGADILAFDATSGSWLGMATTNLSGHYSVSLAQGSYKLVVDAHNPTYPALWYGGTGFANATIYVLTANRTVDLSLSLTNTAPVAVADTYSTAQTTTLSVATPGVLANDTDAESNPLTAVLNTTVGHGTLTLNANGSFSYTPTAAYTGPDSFTYHANDGSLNSNVVTVSLTVSLSGPVTLSGNVTGNGAAPLAGADILAFDATSGSWLGLATTDVLGHYSVSLAQGSYKLVVDAHNSTYPALWYGGTGFANATIYVLTTNRTADLSLSLTNTAPVAVADTYSTALNTTLTVATPGSWPLTPMPRAIP